MFNLCSSILEYDCIEKKNCRNFVENHKTCSKALIYNAMSIWVACDRPRLLSRRPDEKEFLLPKYTDIFCLKK